MVAGIMDQSQVGVMHKLLGECTQDIFGVAFITWDAFPMEVQNDTAQVGGRKAGDRTWLPPLLSPTTQLWYSESPLPPVSMPFNWGTAWTELPLHQSPWWYTAVQCRENPLTTKCHQSHSSRLDPKSPQAGSGPQDIGCQPVSYSTKSLASEN